MSTNNSPVIDQVKAWLLPGVVGLGFMMFQSNLTEMKADIKQLLAQSERDQVKIEYLEQEVQLLREKLEDITHNSPSKDQHDEIPPTYAILPSKEDLNIFASVSHPTGV